MNKPNFQRDYQFYLENRHAFNFCGCVLPEIHYDPLGLSAMETFYIFDTHGEIRGCCEPDLFLELLICKKSVNLHIKMWASGYEEAMIGFPELMATFKNPPSWVDSSLRKQIYKASIIRKSKELSKRTF